MKNKFSSCGERCGLKYGEIFCDTPEGTEPK